MTGVGTVGGAATIVNAFATGQGAAFGLGYRVEARVEAARAFSVWNGKQRLSPRESRLAIETARRALGACGQRGPVRILITSDIPPKKGLKSSSAVSVAVARACADHAGRRLTDKMILTIAADAGLATKTSLTGAYDDAAACLLGGVVLTDNPRRRLVRRDQLPGDLVALVHTPKTSLATGSLRRSAFHALAPGIRDAWTLASEGRYRDAMLMNTLAYAPLLGHMPTFTFRALPLGAYAAGLSGKGPAEVALVHRDDLRRFKTLRRISHLMPLRRKVSA